MSLPLAEFVITDSYLLIFTFFAALSEFNGINSRNILREPRGEKCDVEKFCAAGMLHCSRLGSGAVKVF